MFEITHETPNSSKILTEDALNFLGKFISAFEERRKQQMHDRSTCYEPFAKAFFEANR